MKSVKEAIKESGITNNVSDGDYPELEGKIIDVFCGIDTFKGLVVGCNYHVGVTIVECGNEDHFIVCLPGPIMPGHKEDCDYTKYDDTFAYLLDGIEGGYLDTPRYVRVVYGEDPALYVSNADGSNCAYRR